MGILLKDTGGGSLKSFIKVLFSPFTTEQYFCFLYFFAKTDITIYSSDSLHSKNA